MKNVTKTFILPILFVFLAQISFGGVTFYTEPHENTKLTEIYGVDFHQGLSIEEALTMTPRQIAKKSGEKLSLKQKIVLRLVKQKIKKAKKKGKETVAIKSEIEKSTFAFHIGGFFLGFFLGLLGVLIAYLAIGNNAGLSSLIGVGTMFVISLAVLVIILSTWE